MSITLHLSKEEFDKLKRANILQLSDADGKVLCDGKGRKRRKSKKPVRKRAIVEISEKDYDKLKMKDLLREIPLKFKVVKTFDKKHPIVEKLNVTEKKIELQESAYVDNLKALVKQVEETVLHEPKKTIIEIPEIPEKGDVAASVERHMELRSHWSKRKWGIFAISILVTALLFGVGALFFQYEKEDIGTSLAIFGEPSEYDVFIDKCISDQIATTCPMHYCQMSYLFYGGWYDEFRLLQGLFFECLDKH